MGTVTPLADHRMDRRDRRLAARLDGPRSEEHERAVIASVLAEPSYLAELDMLLAEEDFADPRYRALWGAFTAIAAASAGEAVDGIAPPPPIDTLTVQDELGRRGELERVGGLAWLAALDLDVPDYHRAPEYARTVRRLSVARQLLALAGEAAESLRKHGDPERVRDLLADASKVLDEGAGAVIGGTLAERLPGIVARLEARAGGRRTDVIRSGFAGLDAEITGFERSELVVVGGYGKIGKTTFTQQLVRHMVVDGERVIECSLEMSAPQNDDRLIGRELAQPQRDLRAGDVNMARLAAVVAHLEAAEWPKRLRQIYPRTTELGAVLRDLRAAAKVHHPSVVVVDHLHCLRLATSRGDRRSEVAAAASALKDLARQLGVLVIAPAQVSREAVRNGGKPRRWHLLHAGDIEQVADTILMLDRKESEPLCVTLESHRQGEAGLEMWLAYNPTTRELEECAAPPPPALAGPPPSRGRQPLW